MRRLLFAALCGIGCARPPAPDAVPVPARVVEGPRANVEPIPQGAVPVRLRIIGTNDFHGALDARPDDAGARRGGAAYVATAIRAAQAQCPRESCEWILVDGGDMFQGTAASNFVFGRSVVDLYNHLGYSAAAVGNHEFDWGQDTLRALMRSAWYPILGANIRYKDGRDVPWIPNDTIIKRGPFSIGIIGVTTVETPTATWAAHVADLAFVDPTPIIDSIAPVLRARGAQFVIVVGHIGARCAASGCSGEAMDIAATVKAKIDAVISGHSHTRVDTDFGGIPVVQARSRGQAIDIVDLYVGGARPRHEVREIYSDSLTPDPGVLSLVASASSQLDRIAPQVNRPVAQIASTIRNSAAEHGLGNLIADAMRVTGGGDLAIMNNGGIRQALPAGTATYGSLFEVQPFGNNLMRVRVRGSGLRGYFTRVLQSSSPGFRVSGARIVYHAGPPFGIDTLTVLGRPINDQAVYTVVISDFLANGGDGLGFGSAGLSVEPTGVTDLDALIAYLASLPQPVTAPADPRVIRLP